MATVYNLAIDQGANFLSTITVTDSTGSARNLASYSARGQLKRSYNSVSNVQFTVEINNPSEGEIQVSLNADETANLKYGRYVYDLELIDGITYNIERLLEGIVTVYPEVTK